MVAFERLCPQCGYRTTQPVTLCPICDVPLGRQERDWKCPRQAVRVPILPGIRGELDSRMAVTVLDLSPLGARLEHAEALFPRQPCLLSFDLPDATPLRLPGSIAWTRAYPSGPEPLGTRCLYRSGVQFRDPPATVARALSTYLERAGGSPKCVPGTVALRGD